MKQSVAFELGQDENIELSLVTYKGCELRHDDELDLLPYNAMVFAVLKGNAESYLKIDETFDYHNFLVPYKFLKTLGEVLCRLLNSHREGSGRFI